MDITEEELNERMDVDELKELEIDVNSQIKENRKLPTNGESSIGVNIFKEIPPNLKHLVDKESMELVVKSDGACGTNAVAAHIFNDQNRGPEVTMIKNTHIGDHWDYYKDKISLPYERKVGVGASAIIVKFKDGEEEQFLKFLRSEDSKYLWSDSVDLHAMCNIYQFKIKVIRTLGDDDMNPKVYYFEPDSQMDRYKSIPSGVVPDMTLINYKDKHFNLVVQRNENTGLMKNSPSQLSSSLAMKLQAIAQKVVESELTIQKLKQEISNLETELKAEQCTVFECTTCKICFKTDSNLRKHLEKSHNNKFEPDIKETTATILKVDSKQKADAFECSDCEISFDTRISLKNHTEASHKKNVEYNCHYCSFQGHDEASLKKHYSVSKHNSSEEGSLIENNFHCHSCGENFALKKTMMEHRRDQHKDQIKRCRYFLNGICEFEDETCWYRHSDNQNEGSEFRCSFCDVVLKSKAELIAHRQNAHAPDKVKVCRDYQRGSCRYSEDECWYKHVSGSVSDHGRQSSIFQNAPRMNHRPENAIMEKTMEMMQMLISQISSLETKLQN